ncbi:MAG TPA: efflux transporter outer membrane subunit [Verrucomicrobiales bacterium]|nr:efflux transporter outer membrane subunit [Verrucomicrobiales bacterium]
MKKSRIILTAGLCLFSLTACTVGPDYTRPSTPEQTGWKGRTATTASVLPAKWWRIFKDPGLNALEEQAIDANQNLQRAVARVTEARALAGITKSEWYPTVTAGGSYSRNRSSANSPEFPDGAQRPKLESNEYRASFDLSYELDVWGRVRRSVEAANADAESVASDLQVVLLTLTADVARNYCLLRSLDAEKSVLDSTIAMRKDEVHLQKTRNAGGLNNALDETRAETELASAEGDLHSIVRERAQVEHALAVLCGRPAGEFSVKANPSNVSPPSIPVGLPSSLLERRPDIVKAEQEMQASNARIGVAKAAFFPTISLTGGAGFASADLGSFLNWPSRTWSFGPGVHLPIFDGGKNKANLGAANARYEQAVANYRGVILQSFREVEDALSDLSTLSAQTAAAGRAIASSRDTASLAAERYRTGLTNYLDVVDARRAVLQAERLDRQLRGQSAVSTILLAKALGGGWDRGSSSPQILTAAR